MKFSKNSIKLDKLVKNMAYPAMALTGLEITITFPFNKLEAIGILLRKPILCLQRDFNYTVSLSS